LETMSDDIFTAAERNNTKRIEELVQDGADVNEKDFDRGSTPLHFACAGGNLDAIEVLLEYSGDINSQNKHGRTPLHCLISERYDKIALWLIQYCNADPHIQDKRGVSSYDLAQRFFQPEIDTALKNRVVEEVVEEEAEVQADDEAEKKDIKIFNAKGKFLEINVTEFDSAGEVISKFTKKANWPDQFLRYFDLMEVITKRVGSKRYKKQTRLEFTDNLFDKEAAWPDQESCYFLLAPKERDVPTKVHVAYENIV